MLLPSFVSRLWNWWTNDGTPKPRQQLHSFNLLKAGFAGAITDLQYPKKCDTTFIGLSCFFSLLVPSEMYNIWLINLLFHTFSKHPKCPIFLVCAQHAHEAEGFTSALWTFVHNHSKPLGWPPLPHAVVMHSITTVEQVNTTYLPAPPTCLYACIYMHTSGGTCGLAFLRKARPPFPTCW